VESKYSNFQLLKSSVVCPITYNLNELINDLLVKDLTDREYYDDEENTEINSLLKRHGRNKNLRKLGV